MSQLPECVEVGPADASHSVIWLHGLGADGHDFEPLVPELGLDDVRFVLPHAPVQPVTVNGGMPMRAWYDIRSPQIQQEEDSEGIHASQAMLEALIRRERERGIASRRLILAGFSQGGAIALHSGLRHGEPLGGILALSTYLPLAATFEQERTPINQTVPIFMAHGKSDPIVPLWLAEDSRYFLEQAGYSVDWHTYPIQHQVALDEIGDIAAWLRNTLS
ncbi:MAG: alpha/beta hydrolase [Thiohalophilus sp.]|uniref:alpha/beta hydrolase n=1 Tax=Thiohalophilus sp. TaxID=3028392 RepID=UPI00287070BE|nr:alpha/beta hydrolase [Thiohalophilus sp.]MDR9437364.1 alpha/beta hydrolase [Thiohalophilus sp.]